MDSFFFFFSWIPFEILFSELTIFELILKKTLSLPNSEEYTSRL